MVHQALFVDGNLTHPAHAGGGLSTQAVCLAFVANFVQAVKPIVQGVVLVPWARLVQDGRVSPCYDPKRQLVRQVVQERLVVWPAPLDKIKV